MRNHSFKGDRTLMSMAKGLVCGSTKKAVPSSAITISDFSNFPTDSSFTYTVNRTAVSTCGVLYWDPMLTPFGGYETHVDWAGLLAGLAVWIYIVIVAAVVCFVCPAICCIIWCCCFAGVAA